MSLLGSIVTDAICQAARHAPLPREAARPLDPDRPAVAAPRPRRRVVRPALALAAAVALLLVAV